MMTKYQMINALSAALEGGSWLSLSKAMDDFRVFPPEDLMTVRIFVLRDHSIDHITDYLRGYGLLEGMAIETFLGRQDAILDDIRDEGSVLNALNPDLIVVSLRSPTIEILSQIYTALSARFDVPVIYNTALKPASDEIEGIGRVESVMAVNAWLVSIAQNRPNVFLIDWNKIEERLGARIRTRQMWEKTRSLLTDRFLNQYALEIFKHVRLSKDRSRKVLVLDGDNTLWGGYLGEEGVKGIQLDPEHDPGSAYYRFQETVLKLHKHGIMIALCSNNNEADVLDLFKRNKHCRLTREHFCAWRLNGESKAENLRAMAEELNVGLEYFVFVDDNPVETNLIREALPEVLVLEMPLNLARYSTILFEKGYFDQPALTEADMARLQNDSTGTPRRPIRSPANDIDDYLTSLSLSARFFMATPLHAVRISLMTQRQTLFNMTGRRYSEDDIRLWISHNATDIMCLELEDCFGNYGMVGVCVMRYIGISAVIDTFLISSRVSGRRAEDVFLSACLQKAKEKGYEKAIGRFILSPKNAAVKDFYQKSGFVLKSGNGPSSEFVLDLKEATLSMPSFYRIAPINFSKTV